MPRKPTKSASARKTPAKQKPIEKALRAARKLYERAPGNLITARKTGNRGGGP